MLTSTDGFTLTQLTLSTLLFLSTLSNLTLSILANLAWSQARQWSASPACRLRNIYCGFTRWALFLLLGLTALICFVTTSIMTIRSFRQRFTLDSRYVFRGAVFTVCMYAPLVYLGWQDVTVVGPETCEGGTTCLSKGVVVGEAEKVLYEGITGAFILETMDAAVWSCGAALMMAHVCLGLACLVVGIAAATANTSAIVFDALPDRSFKDMEELGKESAVHNPGHRLQQSHLPRWLRSE